jgi:hypothetical protein
MAPLLAAGVISLNDFQEVLSRYDALIQSVSKPSNKDGKGLQELDTYRLVTVPTRLEKVRQEGGELYLEKEEVESLIRWKLYVYPLYNIVTMIISKTCNRLIIDVIANMANFDQVSCSSSHQTVTRRSKQLLSQLLHYYFRTPPFTLAFFLRLTNSLS